MAQAVLRAPAAHAAALLHGDWQDSEPAPAEPRVLQLELSALAVLEILPFAVILASADGRALHCSAKATQLLRRSRHIALGAFQVVVAPGGGAAASGRIRQLIVQACAAPEAPGPTMLLGSAEAGLYVTASPLGAVAPGMPCVALFVEETSATAVLSPEMLQRLFALTRAESEVVASLANGRNIGEIAAGRHASVHTVRDQVGSSMAKLGVRRQAELVGKVLSACRQRATPPLA